VADEVSQDERTEQATPRKREQAREKGQVARSQELNSVAIIFFGMIALVIFASSIYSNLANVFFYNVQMSTTDLTIGSVYQLFLDNGSAFLKIIAPILIFLGVVGILINLAQVGALITFKPLEPKLDKLNIISGAGRLFSTKTIIELFRDTIKITIIGYIAYLTLKSELKNYVPLVDQEVGQIMAFMARVALKICLRVSGALLVLAILDYVYQKFDFERRIRMTKQEIKEEYKLFEGDPLIKSRIRRIQRELAHSRMLQDVPKADVVITNPTHLAVAIQYDPESMSAPKVVAKGERLIAEKIKEIAAKAGVPIVENQPLARAIYEAVDIGMSIPAKLYRAVAEVLAYVYKLKGKI
jgi:flagellar biosynthetic protein FlhB